jgi:hypothetical protein
MLFRGSFAALMLSVAVGLPTICQAAPFTLSTVLLGDPRPDNPDDLRVLVTVTGDTLSNVTYWTVDLDMASTHPDARLDEFGFNLVGAASNYRFSNLNLPYTPIGGTLNGSGNTSFLLTLNDPNGNARDADNITNLRFRLTDLSGNFSLNDFLSAPLSCSNDSLLGCNQLGAHVQSLTRGASGVAVGDYPTTSVPEPGTLLLMTAGLGLALVRKRRSAVDAPPRA